jgi:hypothetical protein
MSKLSEILPANRIALGATWLAGLGATVCGLAEVFPNGSQWANYALVAGGLITKLATSITFALGSQKYDALVANSADLRDVSPDDDAVEEDETLEDPEEMPADEDYNGPHVENPHEGTTYDPDAARGDSEPVTPEAT